MSFFHKQNPTPQKYSNQQTTLRIPANNDWIPNSQDPSPISLRQSGKFIRLSSPSSAKNFPLLKASYTSTPINVCQRSTKDNTFIGNTPVSPQQKLNFTLASSLYLESKYNYIFLFENEKIRISA